VDGTLLTLGVQPEGGQCGEWADHDGVPAIEFIGKHHRKPGTSKGRPGGI
jgi:hypothetical protein